MSSGQTDEQGRNKRDEQDTIEPAENVGPRSSPACPRPARDPVPAPNIRSSNVVSNRQCRVSLSHGSTHPRSILKQQVSIMSINMGPNGSFLKKTTSSPAPAGMMHTKSASSSSLPISASMAPPKSIFKKKSFPPNTQNPSRPKLKKSTDSLPNSASMAPPTNIIKRTFFLPIRQTPLWSRLKENVDPTVTSKRNVPTRPILKNSGSLPISASMAPPKSLLENASLPPITETNNVVAQTPSNSKSVLDNSDGLPTQSNSITQTMNASGKPGCLPIQYDRLATHGSKSQRYIALPRDASQTPQTSGSAEATTPLPTPTPRHLPILPVPTHMTQNNPILSKPKLLPGMPDTNEGKTLPRTKCTRKGPKTRQWVKGHVLGEAGLILQHLPRQRCQKQEAKPKLHPK